MNCTDQNVVRNLMWKIKIFVVFAILCWAEVALCRWLSLAVAGALAVLWLFFKIKLGFSDRVVCRALAFPSWNLSWALYFENLNNFWLDRLRNRELRSSPTPTLGWPVHFCWTYSRLLAVPPAQNRSAGALRVCSFNRWWRARETLLGALQGNNCQLIMESVSVGRWPRQRFFLAWGVINEAFGDKDMAIVEVGFRRASSSFFLTWLAWTKPVLRENLHA